MTEKQLLRRKILMALIGMGIAGLAVGFFKRAFFGMDPFQCFCNGINQIIPIGFGTLPLFRTYILFSFFLFFIIIAKRVFNKTQIPIGI